MRFNYIILFLFLIFTKVNAQFIITQDTAVCLGSEVNLLAAGANSSPSLVNTDDVHSDVIDIGFDFNFYGNVYNQCVLSANGYITFDFAQANLYSPWPINAAIPDPGVVPENAIMAPWHDIDPGVDGSIVFGTYGVAPNRVFYVVWCNIPMFSCNDLISSQYLLLYESSNKIEMHIEDKPLCAGWNGGAAVQGIVNENSTLSDIVIDPVLNQPRNFPLQWTANDEGWEFVPNADFTSYAIAEIPYSPITTGTITWLNQFGDIIANDLSTNVTPNIVGDNYFYISIVDVCTGESIENADSVLIQVAPPTIAGADSTVFLCNSDETVDLNNYLNGHQSGGEWFYADFLSIGNFLDPSTAQSGDYSYITYGLHPNCNDTAVVNITIDILPYAGLEAFKLVCSGDAVFSLFDELNGNPDDGGVWINPDNIGVSETFNPSTSIIGEYTYFIEGQNACPSASQTVNLSYQESFAIETFTSSVTCPGASDGSILLIPESSTVSPITYSIDNGSNFYNFGSFNNLDFGDYEVLVRDGNGCIVDTLLNINSSEEPIQVFASSQNVLCPGDSIGQVFIDTIIGGNSSIAYDLFWFSSETDEEIGVGESLSVPSGGYYIIAQQNSCYGTDGVIVNDYNELSYTINKSDISCYGGEDGIISVNVNGGGTPPYSYNWLTNGGANTSSLFNLPSGVYTLEISDANNCITNIDVELTAPLQPLSVIQSASNMSCFGVSTGSAQVLVNGGTPPYTYNWSSGNVTSFAEQLPQGTYQIDITDSRNCQITEEIVIEENSEIITSISTQQVSCFNGFDGSASVLETTGGVGSYTYTWSNGFNSTSISNLNYGDYWLITQDSLGCTIIDTAYIGQPEQIKIFLTPTDVLCYNDTNGSILADVNGGVSFLNETYTYEWSFNNQVIGFNSEIVSNLHASELPYQLTVTDYNGCSSDAFTFINQSEELRLDTSQLVPAYCQNIATGSVSLVAYGGFLNSGSDYQFSWESGELSPTLINQTSGNYTAYVEDDNGCKDTLHIEIPLEATFSSTIYSEPLSCFENQSGQAIVNISGGYGPYSYLWDYPGGEFEQESDLETNIKGNLPSGIASVVVIDVNGCAVSNQTNLTEPDQLFYNVYKDNDETCSGDVSSCDGQFTINAFGGTGDYTFNWFDLQMNLIDSVTISTMSTMASNLCSGFYQFSVIDERGCIAVESGSGVVFPAEIVSGYNVQSQIDLSSYDNNIICYGDTAAFLEVLNPNPSFNYLWSSNGQPFSNGLSTTIVAGSISLQASYQNCVTTSTNLIVEQPDPTLINSTVDNINCYGENTGYIETETINPQGLTYLWSNGSVEQSIFDLTAGNYVLTTTNSLGCETNFDFNLSQPLSITTVSNVIDVNCFGGDDGEVSLDISGGIAPYTINWQGNDPFNLEAGQYEFIITDASNCQESVFTEVNGPTEIIANFNSNVVPFLAIVNGGVPSYNYQWLYFGNEIPNANNNSHNPTQSGAYSLLVTDANGCEGRSTEFNYTIESVNIDVSILELVNIYPNPMSSVLYVEYRENTNEELNLKLVDSKGSLVYETKFIKETIIERDNFSKGVYSLIITGKSTQIIEKIIVSDFYE